jgi:hypothetical protein
MDVGLSRPCLMFDTTNEELASFMAHIQENFTMSQMGAMCFNGQTLNLVDFGRMAGKTVEITFTMYQATETSEILVDILCVHILED